jgi:hypothetical protein
MEHFAQTTQPNENENENADCKYDDNSSPSTVNCNDCFYSQNCTTSECQSVCSLEFCGDGEEDCSEENLTSIVDLYKSLFVKMKQYFADHDTLNNINIDFASLSNLGNDSVRAELWNLLKEMYEVGTLTSKSNYVDKQRLDNILKSQEYIISDDGVLINNLKSVDNTMKRQMEINFNEYRKTQYNLRVIKQAIVFIAIILIIPALVKFGILEKKVGLVVWFILLVVLLIYVIFMIVVKNRNRDDIDFKKYNFVKPTDEEVARSRIAASMSSKDKAKCKTLAQMDDDFDPESINIDITPYKSDTQESAGQCFSGN